MNFPVAPIRKRRKEARPAELLAAALDLFVARGFAATRLEDVAAQAGVSKGTLYLYFENKEALFKAVNAGHRTGAGRERGNRGTSRRFNVALLKKLLDNWSTKIGLTAYAGIPKLMVAEATNFPDVAPVLLRAGDQPRPRPARHRTAPGHGMRRIPDAGSRGRDRRHHRPGAEKMLFIWKHSLGCCAGCEHDPQQYCSTSYGSPAAGAVKESGIIAFCRN